MSGGIAAGKERVLAEDDELSLGLADHERSRDRVVAPLARVPGTVEEERKVLLGGSQS
jgi:hypothetical protein